MNTIKGIYVSILLLATVACSHVEPSKDQKIEQQVEALIKKMTTAEKIGQMTQRNGGQGLDSMVKSGVIGSILNEINTDEINRLQRIAMEESRLGIPLIVGRDVIHGFNTIFPIPLGQAASFNPELVEEGARIAAIEARSVGINWTFAPMIDVARDPRWGRVAEGFGEDPYLTSVLAVASVKGYQGNDLSDKNRIAACAKHFAAYGATESGRDYHTVRVPENDLRDIYFPPFKAALDAGVATFMSAFNDINGVPASGNEFLFRQVLRNEWNFDGFVVSDWESIRQLVTHGYAADNKDAAKKSVKAGIDMEMASTTYENYLQELIKEGAIDEKLLDESVRNILRVKFRMGLFDNPYTNPADYPKVLNDDNKQAARNIAAQSVVLLKNENQILPLKKEIKRIAVIGPLANSPHDQMGTWVFDGKKENSVTPLTALREMLGSERVAYAEGMKISRTLDKSGFPAAIAAARNSDVVILFIGEESILSGESHCRADINLPGIQEELIQTLAQTGKPIVAVVMAGRPLTFETAAEKMNAILYAWHPGTMGGPAIADLLFGIEVPSGKLPITFPRVVGQIPTYYAQKNSGKPASDKTWEKMYDIPVEAFQLSVGNTNHYIDYGFEPWFPFGYGLSYTTFEYNNISMEKESYQLGDSIHFTANISNTGNYKATDVAQLYIRDLVGDRTRPVRELKGFKRITLEPGESQQITFAVHTNELAFTNQKMQWVTEPGNFDAWIGGNSKADLNVSFKIE